MQISFLSLSWYSDTHKLLLGEVCDMGPQNTFQKIQPIQTRFQPYKSLVQKVQKQRYTRFRISVIGNTPNMYNRSSNEWDAMVRLVI